MEKVSYWIPIRTIAATEKDKWLECSNCGNHINQDEKVDEWILCNLNHQINARLVHWKKAYSYVMKSKAVKKMCLAEMG